VEPNLGAEQAACATPVLPSVGGVAQAVAVGKFGSTETVFRDFRLISLLSWFKPASFHIRRIKAACADE
jgi:hypothetical protein